MHAQRLLESDGEPNATPANGGLECAGAILGGSQGVLAAIRTKPESGADTARLRLNRFLNLSGKSGRSAGNALGVLGFFFASLESGYGYLADGRLPDAAESVAAGVHDVAETPSCSSVFLHWKR